MPETPISEGRTAEMTTAQYPGRYVVAFQITASDKPANPYGDLADLIGGAIALSYDTARQRITSWRLFL